MFYEKARKEFLNGLTSKITSERAYDKFNHQSGVNLQRYYFGLCVLLLREAHEIGEVEAVDKLPFPLPIVFLFTERNLEKLAFNLYKLYFPDAKSEIDRVESIIGKKY